MTYEEPTVFSSDIVNGYIPYLITHTMLIVDIVSVFRCLRIFLKDRKHNMHNNGNRYICLFIALVLSCEMHTMKDTANTNICIQ